MSLSRNSVLTSFIWKFLERGSVQVFSFIVTIILARLLTPDDYGSIALVMIFISLATVFVEGGLSTALIQKKDCDSKDYSTILYFSLFISVVVYLILFFSAPSIGFFYKKPELESVVRVLGICLFFNAINSVQKAYLSKYLLFKKLFYSSLIGVATSAIVGIWMAYKGYGVWALVTQQLVSTFLITFVMWFTVKWKPTPIFSIRRFYKLFDFGWKIFLSNLVVSLFVNIRSLIIGRAYSASSLAYFDKGKQFPSLIMDNIITSIQSVMFPVLSIEQDNRVKVKAMMRRSTSVSSYVIFPLLVGMFVIAKPLTIALLTDKWIGVVPYIQIFCIANIFMPIQNVNMVAIKSLGYSNITLKLELIKKVLEVTILVVSVFFGVKAIAWGVVLYNLICVFINLYPSRKLLNYGYKEQLNDVVPSLFIASFMGLSIYWIQILNLSNFIIVIIQILIGGIIYYLLSRLFKVDSYLYIMNIYKERELKN